MKIGYLRVSTEEQRPDRQIDGLKSLCDEIHIEKISAISKKRPVYETVMQRLQPGDTFVVWDLDRAFRSTVDALLEMEKLQQRNIGFQIVMLNVDTTTPDGELFYTMVAAFARYEHRMISKRTKEGLAAAKSRGKRIGRPPALSYDQVRTAFRKIHEHNSTIIAEAKILGVCRDTLSKAITKFNPEI
jgi:DNA invertase Pin-like site-specific DNA recombinase